MSIAATLPLEQAGSRCWDVVVLGAGPAGAMAAYQLSLRGRAVLLVDKASFPRWKVCGCCLNGAALATLQEVGLSGLAPQAGAVPLQQVFLATPRSRAHLSLPGGVALSREALDAGLVEAAVMAGTTFLPSTTAALGEVEGSARRVFLRQRERTREVRARLVLLAVGLGGLGRTEEPDLVSRVEQCSRIGAGVVTGDAPIDYRAGTIYMACGTAGYLGLVRREDGQLNLAAAWDPAAVRQSGGPGKAAAGILQQVGWTPIPHLAELPWRGTPALTRRAGRLGGERLLVLGDAAGYVEPFTGEGIAWALAAGAAVAPLASQAVACWKPEWEARWTARYTQQLAGRQRFCRVVTQVLRRPMLTRLVIGLLEQAPGLAQPFLRSLTRK